MLVSEGIVWIDDQPLANAAKNKCKYMGILYWLPSLMDRGGDIPQIAL